MFTSRRKNLLSIVIILLFLFSNAAMAQKEEDNDIDKIEKFIRKKRVNAAYLILGQNMLHLDQLNNTLASRDFPVLPGDYLTYGFGGHLIHDKYVLGLELMRSFGRKNISAKDFNTFLSLKYSVLNIGYLLYSKKGLMIYPVLGLGVGELRLKVMENDIQSFRDIDNSHLVSDSKTHSFLVNLGGALDYFINFDKKKQGKNNLVIGIRAGYLISAVKFKWAIDGIRVEDGPSAGLTGPYVRLTVGLGGLIEKLIIKAI